MKKCIICGKPVLHGQIINNHIVCKECAEAQAATKAAETKLKKEYANVYNPAHLPDNMAPKDYEYIESTVLKNCDTIYLLKGWNKSVGARRELYAFISMHKDGEIIVEGE